MAKIGHGGMAEVFVGMATGIGGFEKLAVVKRIHPQLLEEPSFVNMFLDEARLAARLSHPNVVETYDVGEHDGVPFIAMEYLEGAALDRVVKLLASRKEVAPPEVGVSIAIQVLHALHHAHELKDFEGRHIGVVHRDISPSNMHVTHQGTVVLLDFGIAKATMKLAETRTGQIKGKLSYMAPEQARGRGVDRRADIWSVGVTLYELITAGRLFAGETEIATLQNLLTADVDQLLDAGSERIPPEVLEVLRKSLRRDAEERFSTAQEMADALQECLDRMGARAPDATRYLAELLAPSVQAQRETIATLLQEARRSDATAGFSTGGSSPGLHSSPGLQSSPGYSTPGLHSSPGTPSSVTPARDTAESSTSGKGSRARPAMAGVLLLLAIAAGAFAAVAKDDDGADVVQVAPVATDPTEAASDPESPPETEATVQADGTEPEVPSEATSVESGLEDPEETDDLAAAEAEAEAAELEETERDPRARWRRMRRLRRMQQAHAGMQTEQGGDDEAQTAGRAQPEPEPTPALAPGYLTLITTPWSEVSIGSRTIGTTPLHRVELPAGTHTLRLRNSEAGIDTHVQLTVPPGQNVTRRLGL